MWYAYVVQVSDRSRVQEILRAHGVGSLVHYPVPPHLSGAYASQGFEVGQMPISEALANRVLSLPMGAAMADEEVVVVADELKKAASEADAKET